jgi:hypothetical protein
MRGRVYIVTIGFKRWMDAVYTPTSPDRVQVYTVHYAVYSVQCKWKLGCASSVNLSYEALDLL